MRKRKEPVLLVPQEHRRVLVDFFVQEQELVASQLPHTMDSLRFFLLKGLGEPQGIGKGVVGKSPVPCQ